MACDISLGRLEPCLEGSNGGLRAVYWINYDSALESNLTIVDEQVTALTAPVTCFKYELKGANSFDEANERSREAGTNFWTGAGTFVFKKQDLATQKELKLLSYGRPQMIVEDYNGNFRLAGLQNGCECAVSTASGAAMGDTSGYNIAVTSQENGLALFIDPTLMDNIAGFVITEGV